jgi:uncharacterized protein YjbI with pentapeptide repeats
MLHLSRRGALALALMAGFALHAPAFAQGRSFKDQDLANKNFMGQRLDGADFSGANLSGANFTNASLRGANFQEASGGTAAGDL